MTSLYGVHWIGTHKGPEDRERFAAWQPPFVKIVCVDERPPYLEDVPSSAKVIIRNHPLSENNGTRNLRTCDPVALGKEHAIACDRMGDYCETRGIPNTRLLFEGLNEPQVWGGEPPDLTAAYYSTFLQELHTRGLHGVVLNFGVGWPGNDGPDRPPMWAPYAPVLASMQSGDYLGLHEYWDIAGPSQNWRWWAGRYLQCPWQCDIIITECGIDRGVAGLGVTGGWWELPGTMEQKAAEYVKQLGWYEQQLRQDKRVAGALPFTYDIGGREWEHFDIRNNVFMAVFLPYVKALPAPAQPPVVPAPTPDPTPTPTGCEFALRRPLADGTGSVKQWFGDNPASYAMYGLAGHEGLDYAIPVGTPVLAAHAGKVTLDTTGNYGQHVVIANSLMSTVYAHLSIFKVANGQTVKVGDCIGLSGNTGRTTGPHLHFGYKVAGIRNPAYQDFIDPVIGRKLHGDA
jgi:hypothetical protein